MYVKLILSILGLFIFNSVALGQTKKIKYPKTKIRLGTEIAYTNFLNKQPLLLILCTSGCSYRTQSTKPSFTFGGQVNFFVRPRHYLGLDYRWQQIKIKQHISDGPNGRGYNWMYKTNLNYHSLSIQHQFQINPTKKDIWWSNAVGTDLSCIKDTSLQRECPLFYRTSLSFPLRIIKKLGPTIEPFVQLGITGYSVKTTNNKPMRPFMVGLMVNIPYDIYKD